MAVIGSGPSGLAAAAELNAVGHTVTVYERDEGPGGLMRFGVPDAKMEKWIIDRRVKVLEEEGIEFRYGVEVGADVDADQLAAEHDAVVVCVGSRVERELNIPGSDLDGVHFAMDYLYQRNRAVARDEGREAPLPEREITGAGKKVVIIGGGDTGMDCLSSANREGAESALMLDVYRALPEGGRYEEGPWPESPRRTPTTYALDEGGERRFGTQITEIEGKDGHITRVHGRKVEGKSSRDLQPVEGSEFIEEADLCLVAIGFTHPEHDGVIAGLGLDLDARGNIAAPVFATSRDGRLQRGRRAHGPVADRQRHRRRPPRRPDRGPPAARAGGRRRVTDPGDQPDAEPEDSVAGYREKLRRRALGVLRDNLTRVESTPRRPLDPGLVRTEADQAVVNVTVAFETLAALDLVSDGDRDQFFERLREITSTTYAPFEGVQLRRTVVAPRHPESPGLHLLGAELYDDGVLLRWVFVAPRGRGAAAERAGHRPPESFTLWDDAGTAYTPQGGGWLPGEHLRGDTAFVPAVPENATRLSVGAGPVPLRAGPDRGGLGGGRRRLGRGRLLGLRRSGGGRSGGRLGRRRRRDGCRRGGGRPERPARARPRRRTSGARRRGGHALGHAVGQLVRGERLLGKLVLGRLAVRVVLARQLGLGRVLVAAGLLAGGQLLLGRDLFAHVGLVLVILALGLLVLGFLRTALGDLDDHAAGQLDVGEVHADGLLLLSSWSCSWPSAGGVASSSWSSSSPRSTWTTGVSMSGTSSASGSGAAGAAGAGAAAGALTWTGAAAAGAVPPVEICCGAAAGAPVPACSEAAAGAAAACPDSPSPAHDEPRAEPLASEEASEAPDAWPEPAAVGLAAGSGRRGLAGGGRGLGVVGEGQGRQRRLVQRAGLGRGRDAEDAGGQRDAHGGRRDPRQAREPVGQGAAGGSRLGLDRGRPLLLGVDVGLEGGQRDGVLRHLVDGQAAAADAVAAGHDVQRALEALQGAAVTDVAGGALPRGVAQLQQQLAADAGVGLPGTREGQCAVQLGVAKRVERGVHPWRASGVV